MIPAFILFIDGIDQNRLIGKVSEDKLKELFRPRSRESRSRCRYAGAVPEKMLAGLKTRPCDSKDENKKEEAEKKGCNRSMFWNKSLSPNAPRIDQNFAEKVKKYNELLTRKSGSEEAIVIAKQQLRWPTSWPN